MRNVRFIAPLMVLVLAAGLAQAATTTYTSRSAFNGNDHIEWGDLGPAFTAVSNPFSITSEGGVGMTLSLPDGSFERRDDGNGWAGNFAPGDHLLWTTYLNAGPIAIYSFSRPVLGAGAQIQGDYFGSFLGTISAFDVSDNLLGSLTASGNSSDAADNSAIFLGIRSDTANIAKITFDISRSGLADFAINQLDLATTGVPLPAAAWGGLVLMGGLAVRRIRR